MQDLFAFTTNPKNVDIDLTHVMKSKCHKLSTVVVKMKSFQSWYIAALVETLLVWVQVVQCNCPADTDLIHRVGQTRFFILHKLQRENCQKDNGDCLDYEQAKAACHKHGMKLAKIENMRALAIIGRPLEKMVETKGLKDTWYWLAAKHMPVRELYEWGENGGEGHVQFSNFLYRPPRPTGVAGFMNWKNEYLPREEVDQCLSLALPWPGKGDPHGQGELYGHHTMLDERPCESRQKRHALCESADPSCKSTVDDPFVLTETKVDYFEQGNWIFGDRRYLVNWKHRTLIGAKQYCERMGLKLLEPDGNETGLIPYLKMWSREVTVSQFWTSYSWNATSQTYYTPHQQEAAQGHNWTVNWGESQQAKRKPALHGTLSARSDKRDNDYCVAMVLSYEFKGQLPCADQTSPDCTWSFVDYIPANCFNFLGTVCQHSDKKTRDSLWDPSYVLNVDKGLNMTAVTKEFGYAGNVATLRSKYKQTFGSLHCPEGYRMLRESNTNWYHKRNLTEYGYDYMETYWVVDNELFKKDKKSQCTVSMPKGADGHTRTTKKISCTEWHFYACEQNSKKKITAPGWVTAKPHKMVWKEGPQPRVYPIYSHEKAVTERKHKPKQLAGRMDIERRAENVHTKPWPVPNYDPRAHPDRFILRTVNKSQAFTLFYFPQ